MVKSVLQVMGLMSAFVSVTAFADPPQSPPQGKFAACGEVNYVGNHIVLSVQRSTLMPSFWSISLADHSPGGELVNDAARVIQTLEKKGGMAGKPCLGGELIYAPGNQLVMIPLKRGNYITDVR